MKKPEHHWETPRYWAVRDAWTPAGIWANDSRAESFTLHDRRGGDVQAHAIFGLQEQWLDAQAADDSDVVLAAKAWLVARGQRQLRLRREGEAEALTMPIAPTDLDRPGPRAQRLVTLAPSNLEMVAVLGVAQRVVACEDSSDWPHEVAAACRRLGPDLNPDLAQVAEIAPDLVIASLTVPGMERVVTGLAARGLPFVVLAPRSLADIMADMRRLAAYLGVSQAGELAAQTFGREIETLKATHTGLAKLPVYLEWWPRPIYVPGRDCYSNELIAAAGGYNVFGDREGSSFEVSVEEVAQAQPVVGLVSWCGVAVDKLDCDKVYERPQWANTPMVCQRQVYAIDEALTGRPGPRVVEGIRHIAHAIARARGGRS